MIRPWRSLYVRIAAAYLLLLVILCAAAAWIALIQFNRFDQELEQHLNVHLADNLAMAMAPAFRDGATSPAALQTAQHIVSINPSLALFVLDSDGVVLAAYNEQKCGQGKRVSLAPIRALLGKQKPMLPVLGTAPCTGDQRVFAVAPVTLQGRRPGYLYVVLHGRPYQSAKAMLHESVGARAVAGAIALALVLAGVIGLIWFALLTRRLGALTRAVRRFKAGDYAERIPRPTNDEIGQLARAFNEMAATIHAQVEALRKSDEARRELVANVSHDFRTPLTSLRGYAERLLAAGSDGDTEIQRADLLAVIENTDRLTRLADQLYAVSRLDAAADMLRMEPFPIAELAHDVAVKFMPEAKRRGVRLDVHVACDLPSVIADIWLIERVLSNLIDNALRATPAGGSVDLDVRRCDAGVAVAVTDTGCGIERDELALVTQRFYRTRRSQGEAGTGLGLAIAKDILARHDARLEIDSRVGRGTVVRFVLAAVLDPAPQVRQRDVPAKSVG
jgi:signal transduction histidine kinase